MLLKAIKRISIYFILLFVGITYFTASCESISDGNDVVGWPFVFYEFLGGKRTDNYAGRGWIIENLILDILIVFIITSLMVAMIRQLFNKYKANR